MLKRSESIWETWAFPLESKLQEYVIKRLKAHRVHVTVVKVIRANIDGVSDLLLCVKGKFVAIELKVKNNKPSLLQSEFLAQVAVSGGIIGVAYNWGDVKQVIGWAGYTVGNESKIEGDTPSGET